ncbi:MAG: SPFH domain-containing protein, partial [Dorea sp.]
DPTMAAAHMVGAQAAAMQAAAANEGSGAAMAFMGMNMAQGAGGANAQNLYAMGQQQAVPTQDTWTCACGASGNKGKFCSECGSPRPIPQEGWTCTCGALNKGKFCSECGAKKPAGIPQYRCDKCGWEPEDPKNPPKFCPECGDPFDDGDIVG